MKLIKLLLLFVSSSVLAQITGTVTNNKGEKLPYVNVYIENTTIGTSTNDDGFYTLSFEEKGNHTIVFQYLGYKTVKKQITITKFPYTVNVKLSPHEVVLDEVVISSKEDPAYQIIRNAISSKDKNTNHLQRFTADFYSKGLVKVKNAPKKILGQKVTFPFPLDKTRSGIIYLSETVSKIASQRKPKNFKERIIGSKISGQDNGISFNQADEVNFDLYQNIIKIDQANAISPISNYAL